MSEQKPEQKPFYKHPKDRMGPMPLRSHTKSYALKFPPKIDPTTRLKYDTRKVNLISAKVFRAPAKGRADQFLGTLRIF